jgi:hypothetical protein
MTESVDTKVELTEDEILDVARNIQPLEGSTMEQAFILFARAIMKRWNEQ